LGTVNLKPFFDSFFLVVIALNQGLACVVVKAFMLGWIESHMVGATTCHVDTTPAHAFNDGLKRHIYFQYAVEMDTGLLHGVGLRDGAGKTVKQKTIGAIGLGNTFFD
jgi:hypothetical protein